MADSVHNDQGGPRGPPRARQNKWVRALLPCNEWAGSGRTLVLPAAMSERLETPRVGSRPPRRPRILTLGGRLQQGATYLPEHQRLGKSQSPPEPRSLTRDALVIRQNTPDVAQQIAPPTRRQAHFQSIGFERNTRDY